MAITLLRSLARPVRELYVSLKTSAESALTTPHDPLAAFSWGTYKLAKFLHGLSKRLQKLTY